MELSVEQSEIFDALVQEGDDIMTGLGYERLPDGSWREEDLATLYDLIEEHGLGWVRKKSALMPE